MFVCKSVPCLRGVCVVNSGLGSNNTNNMYIHKAANKYIIPIRLKSFK